MFRLIIVDDERIIREGIAAMIDWQSLGIEVVALCSNGVEAYDAIADNFPDIILTDIKMPDMDGIELIRRVHALDEGIQFIILSGYSEFDYAVEVMKYGVRHYLLKPCNENNIIAAMQDVCASLRETSNPETAKPLPSSCAPPQKDFIRRTLAYVDEHLSNENLSLKYIAENFLYLSADYVGKQFLKETGQKFSAYLNQTRVEKAKELIETQYGDRIYHVAEAVGLGNCPQYFSQLFKKYTGLTPTAYAKRLKDGGPKPE